MKLIVSIFALGVCVCAQLVNAESANLTGTWKDDNGGVYQIRQVGDQVFWHMDMRPEALNAFKGTIHDKTIYGEWADLPGGKLQNSGALDVRIESDSKLVKLWSSANYGGSVWRRQEAAAAPAPVPAESDARGWTGTWDSKGYIITVSEDGEGLLMKWTSPPGGNTDPGIAHCKLSGGEASCEWKSDPEYKDGEKSGHRTGTMTLRLKDGHLAGESVEGPNDFYESHPWTAMKPGAKWPQDWTRHANAKADDLKP